jgi:hypothetical protein
MASHTGTLQLPQVWSNSQTFATTGPRPSELANLTTLAFYRRLLSVVSLPEFSHGW